MKTLRCWLVAVSIFYGGKCSAWELVFEEPELFGYTYTGAVFVGYFFTNWVPLVPNRSTNFQAAYASARASNSFLVTLTSNAVTATEDFNLTAGGRGGGLPRGGFRADRIPFHVAASSDELPGMVLPWEARLQTPLCCHWSTFHIYGRMSLCQVDTKLECSSAVTYTLTNDYRITAGNSSGPVLLRVGDRYVLDFSFVAGAGENGGEAAGLIGSAVVSLTESLLMHLTVAGGGSRITLQGHPGRRYVIERSVDFVVWQQLITNTPPTGTFTFADVEAPVSTTVFYRGVRTE